MDKKNIIVTCAGKRVEVDIFPDERVAVLLQEACEKFEKKPSVMCIVSNGKCDLSTDIQKLMRRYCI